MAVSANPKQLEVTDANMFYLRWWQESREREGERGQGELGHDLGLESNPGPRCSRYDALAISARAKALFLHVFKEYHRQSFPRTLQSSSLQI